MRELLIIFCTFANLFLVGCGDFLVREPKNSITAEALYENEGIARSALIGLYDDLQSGDFTGRNTILRQDLKGPDFMMLTDGGHYMTIEYAYQESSSTTGNSYQIWAQGYCTIKDCNLFLYGISNLEATPVVKDMAAQAKAVKALAYMELCKTFCYPPSMAAIDPHFAWGLPIVRDYAENENVLKNGATRSSLMNLFSYINQLLDEALQDIDPSRSTGGFFSRASIEGLLARLHLYNCDYEKALFFADLASREASLIQYNDYQKEMVNIFNSESIFEIVYTDLDNLRDRMLGFICNQTLNSNNRIDSKSNGYGDVGVSDSFHALLHENPSDVRISLLHEDKTSTAAPNLYPLIHGVDGYSERYYFKYIGDNRGNVFLHNVPLIKLPEMLLIAAEACSEMGQDARALEYLNSLYKARTGCVLSNLFGDDLKDAIFKERRRELALEGFAIWDYLRKGKGFVRDASHHIFAQIDPSTEDGRSAVFFYQTVAPLPLNEMNANPSIRLQQNPGYSPFK